VATPGESDPYLEVVADPSHRRNARLYLIGLGASLLGNNAMSLVSGIWVKSLTGSSTLAGLVSVCVYAPSLAGPFAGVVADRVRRRRWLLALNVISAVVMVSLLAVRSRQTVWIIFAVMTWYGIELVLSSPAEDALFAEMLPLEQRQRSNGWRLGLQETGRLIAPLCGAGLFVIAGGGSVAILDAVTFLVAALLISRIRFHEATPSPSSKNWRVEIVAGLSHVWRTVELRRVLVASSIVMGVSGLLIAAQYSLVQSIHEPPSFLGVLTAGLGGGSVVASLLSSRLLRRVGERWLAVFGMVDFAVGSVLRAMGTLPTAVAGSIVLGFALPWVFLAVLNLAQRRTPISLQGRISAAVTLVFFGPQAPLQLIGALAIRYVTYGQLYLCSAGVALLSAAWLAWTALPRHRVA
jgi:MFS family permease